MAFPCNQFGGQEPGTHEEIKAHVEDKFGITFDMMAKIDVNGENRNDLYDWMINSEVGEGRDIEWNFTNFVINRCGQVVARHEPSEMPADWQDEIVQLLAQSADDC